MTQDQRCCGWGQGDSPGQFSPELLGKAEGSDLIWEGMGCFLRAGDLGTLLVQQAQAFCDWTELRLSAWPP